MPTTVLDRFRLDDRVAGVTGAALAPRFFPSEMTEQFPDGHDGGLTAF
jgi:hypothetical protein